MQGKVDKATTLEGYGITDAYTKTEIDNKGYLTDHQDISGKADKATTLEGYGITDAYTEDEVDKKFDDFIAAYITDDGDTIDKLEEIAAWIVDDEAGAAKIIADVDTNTQKLNGIEAGAQVNVIESVQVNGTAQTITGKTINISVPTGTLANKSEVAETDLALSLATKINDKADSDDVYTKTEIDNALDGKVDTVAGKGLSTNDLTDALKDNYDDAYDHSQAAHAPVDAQANVIETVKVNGTAVTITNKVVDITVPTDNSQIANGAGYLVASDIAGKADAENVYTKTEIDNKGYLVANDISGKADKATSLEGYGITDAYTQDQVDQLLTWGTF